MNVDLSGPPAFRSTEAMSPTLPLPPPRDERTLDLWLMGLASMPVARRDDIRREVARLRGIVEALRLLHGALLDLPCADVGRHLLLLSVIGELRDESSVDALERFIWLSDQHVLGPALPESLGACDFDPAGLLQARAAEMLVWAAVDSRDEAVMRIIGEHPTAIVRLSAIDAVLYQRDDTPQAVAALTERVRAEDVWAVGLPRRTADMDWKDFDRLVAARTERAGEVVQLPDPVETTDVH